MARTSLLVGWLLAAALVALASVLFARANDPQMANLLSNGGFENGTSDWVWLGGTLAVNGQHYEGNFSGAIQLSSSAPAVIRHDVSLEPGGSYALSGRFLFANPSVTQVILELDWRDGQDVLERQQFMLEESDGSSWLAAFVQLAPLPCDAISSEVRVQVVGQPGAIALLDDLRLKGSPPATPCPSPTETPTVSPVPTKTSPPQPTPTRTPSPTSAPSGSPTATRTSSPTRTPTATRTATVIPSVTATALPSATPSATIAPVTPTPSNGLIVNGGFESLEGGQLVGWRTFGGTLLQTSEPVWGGLYAACFVSETASTKWLYQTVPVVPGGWYEMSGYVYQNDPGVSSALLRLSWYESVDASGSAISTADSTEEFSAPENAYRPLTTGPVQAPANAHSANARVLLRPQSAASSRICVDEVSFALTSPPAPVPTATTLATATASATSTPTATWPVTPTRTATATPAGLPTSPATATPVRTPTAPAVAVPTATRTLPASSTAVPLVTATRTPTPTRRSTLAPSPTAAAGPAADPAPLGALLVNSGFESASDEGGLTGWHKHGGVLGQVSDPVHSGAFAAELYSASDSTKWLYQTVVVEEDDWYELLAFVCDDDPWVAAAFLRVSWYESNDGGGSAIAQADSTEELTVPDASYRQLTTGPLRPPPNAHSAAVRVLLRPRDGTAAVIHVDDVSFDAVAPPDPPAETPPAEETSGDVPAGDPSAEPSGAPSASNAPAAGYTSSTLGVSLRAAPAPIVPQPTPVIRRYSSLSAPAEAFPNDRGARWWPWALVVGAIVAATTGAAAYASQRARRAES